MEEKIRFAAGNISRKRERVALYAKSGTDGQTTENQLHELRKIADQKGWQIAREFVDQSTSLSKGRGQGPAFDEMFNGVKRGDFDLIMVWNVDRLGRSLRQLISFLDELHSKNIDLFINKQGVDTTTPAGKMLFQMLDVFAGFERSMIQELSLIHI